jgi:cytochrome c554/c'-like protein
MKTIDRAPLIMRTTSASKRLLRALTGLIFPLFFLSLAPVPLRSQLSTDDHLAEPGWWPRREPSSLKEFAGTAACAKCHSRITASQETTPMARTLMLAANADVLHSRADLAFRNGKYLYQIQAKDAAAELRVTDGERTTSANLLWAFGTGKVGQSYLFLRNGNYLESRVTYFSSLQNLNFTPTRALLSPHDLEEATARPVGLPELLRCFSCHSLGANVRGQLDTSKLALGVTCEACHGPGLQHVQAMQASQLQQGIGDEEGGRLIFNPGRLSPGDCVDFCGACHITWWDLKLTRVAGISNVRAQPYRLMSSKCWGKGDARLTCIACHNPHESLSKDAGSYDSKCLACHVSSPATKPTKELPGAACPVGTKNCTTCHMPKIEIPDMHSAFADHLIRVVRPGAPIPD